MQEKVPMFPPHFLPYNLENLLTARFLVIPHDQVPSSSVDLLLFCFYFRSEGARSGAVVSRRSTPAKCTQGPQLQCQNAILHVHTPMYANQRRPSCQFLLVGCSVAYGMLIKEIVKSTLTKVSKNFCRYTETKSFLTDNSSGNLQPMLFQLP